MLRTDRLESAIELASAKRSRLIFVTGELSGSLNAPDIANLNINKELSAQLTNLPRLERVKSVQKLISNMINEITTEVVLLNGLEILFDRSLSLEPIRLLHDSAKHKTLLVSWPGEITKGGLSYAVPSHPEYRSYGASDLSDVIILEVDDLY